MRTALRVLEGGLRINGHLSLICEDCDVTYMSIPVFVIEWFNKL